MHMPKISLNSLKHHHFPFLLTALLNNCPYVFCFPEYSLHRDDEVVPWTSTHSLHPVMWGKSQNSQAALHQTQEYFCSFNLLFVHLSIKRALKANIAYSSFQISVSPRPLRLLNEWKSILITADTLYGHGLWNYSPQLRVLELWLLPFVHRSCSVFDLVVEGAPVAHESLKVNHMFLSAMQWVETWRRWRERNRPAHL